MKKSMSRILCFLLLATLVMGTLGACSSPKEDKKDTPKQEDEADKGDTGKTDVPDESKTEGGIDHSEYYEITVYGDGVEPKFEENQANNSFFKMLKEKFNFGVKFVQIPGDATEFTSLKLAGGDYADVMRMYDSKMLKAYIEAGAVLELGPLMEQYGQNFKSRNDFLLPTWKMLSGMNDEKVWAYTSWEPDMSIGTSKTRLEFVVRSDILEQQGFPEITTEKDFLNVLEQGLKDNPETDGKPTVGISVPMAWGDVGMLVVQAVHTLGSPSLDVFNQSVWGGYDYRQGKFIDVKTDPAYRAGMKFWNDAWNRGILDREAVTDTTDTFSQKLQQGRALAGYYAVWGADGFNKQFEDEGKPYRYVPVPFMLEEQVARGDSKYQFTFSPSAWSAMVITDNAKYPERIMEVLDYIATEEGTNLYGWGEEGVQYTVDEAGKKIPTADYLEKSKADPDYKNTFGGPRGNAGLGFINDVNAVGQMNTIENDADVVMANMNPKVKEIFDAYGWGNVYGMYRNNPKINFDTTKSVDIKTITPTLTDDDMKMVEKVKSKSADYALKMIMAATEEEFDEYMQELQKTTDDLGLPALIDKWDAEYKGLCGQYGITP